MKILAVTVIQVILWFCIPNFSKAQSVRAYDPNTGIELDVTNLPNRVQFRVVNLNPPASNPNCNRPPSWGYLWTFGDCSLPSTQEDPIHTFGPEVEDYTIHLVLTPKYADEDEVLPEFLKTINVKGPFSTQENEALDYTFQSGKSIGLEPVRECKPGDLNTFLIHFKNDENYNYNNPRIKFHYNAQYLEFDSNYVDSCAFNSYTHQTTHNGSKGHLTFDLPSLSAQEERFMALSLLTKTTAPMGFSLEFKGELFKNQNGGFVSDQLLIMEVKNSHDPNEKLVRKAGNCAIDSLIYTINFENEGTAQADIVYIIDEIDRRLDIHSIQPLHASHASQVGPIIDSISLSTPFNPYFLPFDSLNKTLILRDTLLRRLAFVHSDIQLEPNSLPFESVSGGPPTAGQGSVSYSIKPDIAVLLTDPGKIGTHAEIYFDDNPAIATKAPIINPLTCYCKPLQNNAQMQWIQRVKLGDIDHNSGNDGGYADFRPMATHLSIGSSYPIALYPGFAGNLPKKMYWKVLIDMDQNGAFDSYEVIANGSGTGPYLGAINLPNSASIGPTAMRIITSDTSIATSCTQSVDGEMEDYAVTLQHPMLPDLRFTDQIISSKTVSTGESFTVATTIQNQGPDSIRTATSFAYYLSNDPHFDPSDYFLKAYSVPPLANNASVIRSDTLSIPMAFEGTHYLLVVADPSQQLNENDETNNEMFRSILITERLPDLSIRAMRTCIKHLKPADDLSIDFDLTNRGLSTAGTPSIPVDVKLYLSNDRYLDPTDQLMDSTAVDSIAVGETVATSISSTLPGNLSDGTYFLLLHVDPSQRLTESYESNNTRAKKIKIASAPFSKTPYYTGFECGSLDAFWNLEDSLTHRTGIRNGGSPEYGNFHLLFESPNSGDIGWIDFQTNLHSTASQTPYLCFKWKDFDSTHSDTLCGVYVSDNNGQEFHKVFDLNATGESWNSECLSLDSLSNVHGFNLSTEAIIQFKFRGGASFPNDGLAIDEFALAPHNTGPASIPNTQWLAQPIPSNNDLQLNLYPNPSTGMSTLEYTLKAASAELRIVVYDLLGRPVDEPVLADHRQPGMYQVPIGPLTPGQYLCVITDSKQSRTIKLIVQH